MSDIFISFVNEEAAVALSLKRLLDDKLSHCSVFLTADHWQMTAGERWIDRIEKELRSAKVVIVLLSRRSVARPWINFEAGAAWLNRALLIPVCLGGLTPSDLPKPYNDFQAVRLENDDELYQLVRSTSKALTNGLTPPPFPIDDETVAALRLALQRLLQQAQPTTDDVTAVDLSADARLFLGEAAKSKTGEIVRHDLDQALVIQVNGQSFTAAIGEGKRRAELEGGVSDLERLGLIEDVSGKRTVFALTRKGYSIAET